MCSDLFSQVSPNKYYLEFTDKENNAYTIEEPERFLSERALDRREKQNIKIDFADLPVSEYYVDSLRKLGLEVLNVSKWFNSATVYTMDLQLIDTISNISFVKNVLIPSTKKEDDRTIPKYSGKRNLITYQEENINNYYNYGESFTQISINNGHKLHNKGFRGKGMLIAITDAGFSGLPDLPAFDSIYSDNRVLATRNFVKGNDFVYDYGTHGMRVFSIIGANYPGKLIGSAPEADYLLLMSEDPDTETYIEEINWLSAAEYADSLGADIINVSLGYTGFDTPGFDHLYSDMDGRTAIISRAATVAARKGMIVVSAASNNGNSSKYPWIAAPADADSILTVGAINAGENYASFSSIGPSADGRVKPDVVAMGERTITQSPDGTVSGGNGTSYAAPVISGLVACLWQKFPQKTNMEIIRAVQMSSNYYNLPTDTIGYGIPDFGLASDLLELGNPINNNEGILIYPNPFNNNVEIIFKNNIIDSVNISISDMSGKIVSQMKKRPYSQKIILDNLEHLTQGVYVIKLIINDKEYSQKIIKK